MEMIFCYNLVKSGVDNLDYLVMMYISIGRWKIYYLFEVLFGNIVDVVVVVVFVWLGNFF